MPLNKGIKEIVLYKGIKEIVLYKGKCNVAVNVKMRNSTIAAGHQTATSTAKLVAPTCSRNMHATWLV
jgi:hypothetical protein